MKDVRASAEVVTAKHRGRSSFLALALLVGALLFLAGPLFASQAPAGAVSPLEASPAATPLESPYADCFEWKYPDKAECGALKGKTECKAEPSINTVEKDPEKRKACQPEEGDECFCGDDDWDDEDDDDDDDDDDDF